MLLAGWGGQAHRQQALFLSACAGYSTLAVSIGSQVWSILPTTSSCLVYLWMVRKGNCGNKMSSGLRNTLRDQEEHLSRSGLDTSYIISVLGLEHLPEGAGCSGLSFEHDSSSNWDHCGCVASHPCPWNSRGKAILILWFYLQKCVPHLLNNEVFRPQILILAQSHQHSVICDSP